MTTVAPPAPATPARPDSIYRSQGGHRSRKVRNTVATSLISASFVLALVPLVFVVVFIVQKGSGVFGWHFLTTDIPFSDRDFGGGMKPAVIGTLLITGAATVMAVPLGVLGAIYLNEYGKQGPLARLIRFLAEIMTGVPSIVMGLFIYLLWVLPRKQSGLSGFAGALALGCLMLPIVIRTSEEILRVVPEELREGSYALGSRKVRTIRTVVLPHAAPGIVSGALLAVARAAGETAPLLFVIGIVSSANTNVFKGSNTALSAQIFRGASSPFVAAQGRAYGAALTLVLLVFIFTALARIFTSLYARRSSAGG
jgi:phosphate transport system permease protein